jgi:hypothetical protein
MTMVQTSDMVASIHLWEKRVSRPTWREPLRVGRRRRNLNTRHQADVMERFLPELPIESIA